MIQFDLMKRTSKALLIPLLLIAIIVIIASSSSQAETFTLEQALDIAFQNSPTMKNAGWNLEISQHNLNAQKASLKSQFSLNVTPFSWDRGTSFDPTTSQYTIRETKSSSARFNISQPIKWTDGTLTVSESINWQETSDSYSGRNDVTNYLSSLELRFSQPIFTYNRTKMRLSELELSLENSQLNFALQKLQIERSVTQDFLGLYHQFESVKISQEESTNANVSYEIISNKVEAGISAREELFQADLTKANSQANLDNSRNQYENSSDNFKLALGLDLNIDVEIAAKLEQEIANVNLSEAINHGLKHRMELRQKDIDIQNALFNLTRTGAQNEFFGTLNMSWGLTGTDSSYKDIFDSPSKDRGVAISFDIPLFDWGEKKHRMEASELEIESARLSAEEQQRQIILEIRQAYRNLVYQESQIAIADKNVENARRTYELNLERYKSGDLSSKDIAFYQTQLSQQRLSKVQALINYKIALLDLKIRSLWDFSTGKAVLEL